MELLQKLTLYDLLGYTIPGTLAVWLYACDGDLMMMNEFSLGTLGLLVIMGYVTGAMITEIAERFEWAIEQFITKHDTLNNKAHQKFWGDICKNYKISGDMVKRALEKANITSYDQSAAADVLVKEYKTYMYSAIQSDPDYDRLDTYASAELLYKNMTLVTFYAACMYFFNQMNTAGIMALFGMAFFAIRRVHFAERSRGYTICWFIQKYDK